MFASQLLPRVPSPISLLLPSCLPLPFSVASPSGIPPSYVALPLPSSTFNPPHSLLLTRKKFTFPITEANLPEHHR